MNFKLKVVCHGCDGKKFVNYVKLESGQVFVDDTPTTVIECLLCSGTGKINNGIVS